MGLPVRYLFALALGGGLAYGVIRMEKGGPSVLGSLPPVASAFASVFAPPPAPPPSSSSASSSASSLPSSSSSSSSATSKAEGESAPPAPASETPLPDDAETARRTAPVAEEIAVPDDLPAYVIRGRGAGAKKPLRTVFLTGSCTTPLTTLDAFRNAAAEHGGILALQGDLPCRTKGLRRWSSDSAATHARIEAALRAAGVSDPADLTLVGYSQGAERAEWIANRFHANYTRFVLMAGPGIPTPSRFTGAKAVVTLAGHGDVRENMAAGARRLRSAHIPALYMEIPTVTHGELAPGADEIMGKAFTFLESDPHADPPKHARLQPGPHERRQ